MGVTLKLEFSHFGKIGDELMGAVTKALDTTATAIVAEAKINTPPRVKSGAMMNGWQIENTSELVRTVYNTQEYAIYQEFGTARGVSPHPMLVPAVEHQRASFLDELKKVLG